MPRYSAERILIRCPNWIGDMIAATAAIRCIRNNYARAHITLLLNSYVRPVVEDARWFNDIIEFDRSRGAGEFFRVAKQLRRGHYDLAVLLTHSFSSALLVRMAGIKRRVGHARNGRSFLLTDKVPWPGGGPRPDLVPKVKVYSSLLEYLGCDGAQNQRPQVFTSPETEKRCDELLKIHGRDAARPLLALVPGAAYGAAKLWPPERFAAVADRLAQERNMQPMILTGPGESAIGTDIANQMKTTPIRFEENETNFGILKALVRRAALMICNDTGPRHLAIAWNVPVVVIMGPTDPIVTDSDYRKTIVLRQDVPCGPCYLRRCPTDHRCMRLITPEMVFYAAETLLDGNSGAQ